MRVKSLWVPFVVFFTATVSLRIYQVLFLIDPATGFFEGDDLLYRIFIGALLLFVLIVIFMTVKCKNERDFQFRRNLFAGVFAVAVAVAMGADAGNNLMTYVVNHGSGSCLVLSVFGALSALGFLVAAGSHFSGKNAFQKVPLLALLLPLWECVRAVVLSFIEYTNVTTISGNMLNIIASLTALMFLFGIAKLLSGIITPRTGHRVMLLGLLMMLFNGVASVSQMFDAVQRGFSLSSSWNLLAHMALMLYGFCVLVQISTQMSKPRIFDFVSEDVGPEVGSPGIPPKPQATYINDIIAERNAARDRKPQQTEAERVSAAESDQQELDETDLPIIERLKGTTPSAYRSQSERVSGPDAAEPKPQAPHSRTAEPKRGGEFDMDYIDRLIAELIDKKD